MNQLSGYNFFTNTKSSVIIRLVDHLTKNLEGIKFGGDLAMGRIIMEDGNEAILTALNADQLPAVAVYEETSEYMRVGIGQYIDEKGRLRAIRFKSSIVFDIWATNSYQREFTSSVLTNYFFSDDFDMRKIGFIDFREDSTRFRGFDLTDRILQFHSHQITNIIRRLLYYNVEYEVIEIKKLKNERIEKFIINSNINLRNLETITIGDFGIPYPIFNELKRVW